MKIFWVDLETSGIDPRKNGILSLAYKVEIDGEVKAKGKLYNNPGPGKEIDEGALQVNGFKREQIAGFPSQGETYAKLSAVFNEYVDKYDKADKFYAGGYNVGFDVDFMRGLFFDNGDKYFGSFFFFSYVDPSAMIPFLRRLGLFPGFPVKHRLSDVAEYLGVLRKEDEAHDAEGDLNMTMRICSRLEESMKLFFKGGA